MSKSDTTTLASAETRTTQLRVPSVSAAISRVAPRAGF